MGGCTGAKVNQHRPGGGEDARLPLASGAGKRLDDKLGSFSLARDRLGRLAAAANSRGDTLSQGLDGARSLGLGEDRHLAMCSGEDGIKRARRRKEKVKNSWDI